MDFFGFHFKNNLTLPPPSLCSCNAVWKEKGRNKTISLVLKVSKQMNNNGIVLSPPGKTKNMNLKSHCLDLR